MPLPRPHPDESEEKWIGRCMGMDVMMTDFPDQKQRLAVCYAQFKKKEEKSDLPDVEERRVDASASLELRVDGQTRRLIGYAAVFNSKSKDLGRFVEVVRPGAFRRIIASGADVRALVDHRPELIIGRVKAGTLILREDDRGLYVEITPPDTSVGRDIIENVRTGNIDGMSFSFRAIKETWDDGVVPPLRQLHDVDLFDVSPVTYPAYEKTDVAVRSLEEYRAVRAEAGILSAEEVARRRRLRLAEAEP